MWTPVPSVNAALDSAQYNKVGNAAARKWWGFRASTITVDSDRRKLDSWNCPGQTGRSVNGCAAAYLA